MNILENKPNYKNLSSNTVLNIAKHAKNQITFRRTPRNLKKKNTKNPSSPSILTN